ncbi:trithorax group protein osa isoform X1 [Ixodes scapularis]|uniref:trithorax group protein osa isoform X1 n=1 Tax=Ixodes scapularis TaxID=6945 RepID=UPI001AA0001A|nr:trithorax group protein osa isoform X1 [Ixodes scapularis]
MCFRVVAVVCLLASLCVGQQQYLQGPPPLSGGFKGYQPYGPPATPGPPSGQKNFAPQGYGPPPQLYSSPQRPQGGFASQGYVPQGPPSSGGIYGPPQGAQQPQQQAQGQPASSTGSTDTKEEVKTPLFAAAPLHYVSIGTKLEGDYKFGYDTGKGKDKSGSFREETRLPDGTVKGSYGFIDASGRQRIIKYTAGKEGFKAEGDIYQEGAPKDTIPEHLQQSVSASPSAPQPSPPSPAPQPATQYKPPTYAAPQGPSYPQYQPQPQAPQPQAQQAPSLHPDIPPPLFPNFSASNLAFPSFFQHLSEPKSAAPQPRPQPQQQPPTLGYSPFTPSAGLQDRPGLRSAPFSYTPPSASLQARIAPPSAPVRYIPQFGSPQRPAFAGLQLPAATQQRPTYPQFAQQLGYPYRPPGPPSYGPSLATSAPSQGGKQYVPAQYLQQSKLTSTNIFNREADKAATKPNFQDFLKQFVPRPLPQQTYSPTGPSPSRPTFSPYVLPTASAQQGFPAYLRPPPQQKQALSAFQPQGAAPLYASFRPPQQQGPPPSFVRPAAPQIVSYSPQPPSYGATGAPQSSYGAAAAPQAVYGTGAAPQPDAKKDPEDGSYNAELYDHGLYDPKKYEDPYLGKTSSSVSPAVAPQSLQTAPQGYQGSPQAFQSAPQGYQGAPQGYQGGPQGGAPAQQGQVEQKALPIFDTSLLAYNIGTG